MPFLIVHHFTPVCGRIDGESAKVLELEKIVNDIVLHFLRLLFFLYNSIDNHNYLRYNIYVNNTALNNCQ